MRAGVTIGAWFAAIAIASVIETAAGAAVTGAGSVALGVYIAQHDRRTGGSIAVTVMLGWLGVVGAIGALDAADIGSGATLSALLWSTGLLAIAVGFFWQGVERRRSQEPVPARPALPETPAS